MPIVKERTKPGKRTRRTPGESSGASPGISLWERRLQLAEDELKKAGGDVRGKSGEWVDMISWFDGSGQWGKGEGGRSKSFHRVTSNLIKSNIDALRPQLYFQNPKVKASVKNPNIHPATLPPIPLPDGTMIEAGSPIAMIGGQPVHAKQQAELLESVDNYWLGECRVKPACRRVINDALVLPYGVAKWEWQIETEKQDVPIDMDPETREVTETRAVDTIVSEKPVFRRVKPWQFLMDPELDEFDLFQARWVAEIHYLSMDEMRARKFENLADLGEAAYTLGEDAENVDVPDDEAGNNFKRYKVYEIHDIEKNELRFLVEGAKKWQKVEAPNPYGGVEGTLYTLLGFDETIDCQYPLSKSKQIITKVKARNYVLSYLVNHIARFNRKYKALEGSMSPSEMEKLEIGGDGTIVTVKTMGGGPDPIADAPVSVDMYNAEGLLKREITEEYGVTAYNRGGREPGVETAYEVDKIQAGADVKTEEMRDTVREFMRLVVEKLNQMLQTFMTQKKAIEIAGEKGSRWVQWGPEDIKGQFLIDVDIYSAMPFSILQDRRQAMEYLSLVREDPYYDPIKVRESVNKRMGWPEDALRATDVLQQMGLVPMPNALAQMQQMGGAAPPEQQMRPGGANGKGPQTASDMMGGMMGGMRGGRRPAGGP